MIWDESLYAGSAAYYSCGRMPYPPELATALQDELLLDRRGRLLDVGCGPGSLTLLLAPLFERAVGVDADAEMLAKATRQAESAGLENVDWVHLRSQPAWAPSGSRPSRSRFIGCSASASRQLSATCSSPTARGCM